MRAVAAGQASKPGDESPGGTGIRHQRSADGCGCQCTHVGITALLLDDADGRVTVTAVRCPWFGNMDSIQSTRKSQAVAIWRT